MPKSAVKFKNMSIERQVGELGRLRVLGGPDSGFVYVILSARVTIGRGEENDIILSDLKASRKHAELTIAGNSISVKDLGSSHGIAVNGKVSRGSNLLSGDRLGIGMTVLEFVSAEQGNTRMISKAPDNVSLMVGTGISGLTQFISREAMNLRADGKSSPTQSFLEKNRKFLTVLVALMVIAALLPEVERKQRAKRQDYLDPHEIEAVRGPSSLTPPEIQSEIVNRANVQFKEGFREYREQNYLRAMAAFETALQIYPSHALSKVYLESTKKRMEEDAKSLVKYAQRDEEGGRLGQAIQKYEKVKRLYLKDQSNPLYKEAQLRIEDLGKKLKGQENES